MILLLNVLNVQINVLHVKILNLIVSNANRIKIGR
jgi:hypothetical protein